MQPYTRVVLYRHLRQREMRRMDLRSPLFGRCTASLSSSASSSVDKAEVEKFNAYGQGWWEDQNGRTGAGPLHALNPVRVRYILEHCGRTREGPHPSPPNPGDGARKDGVRPVKGLSTKSLHGMRILDVGCGGGLLSEALARLGASVTGIDPALQNIDVARKHAAVDPCTQGIVYEQAAVEDFRGTGQRFDAVVSSEVIEHVAAPASFVKSLAGMLVETEEHSKSRGDGKGGRVVLTTINRTVKAYLLAVLGAEYIARIIPRGTHQWKKFLQPQEIARMGADAGLGVEDVTGLIYNPITNTWRLDKNDIDVNFAMCLKGERGQGQRGKA